MTTPFEFNNRRFQILNSTAFFLGEKKREIRIINPCGEDLECIIREIKNVIFASNENDLIEEFEICVKALDASLNDEEKCEKLHDMLDKCRKKLREYKLEYGFVPGEIDEAYAYGLFSIRNGNVYYKGRPVNISNQPEMLLKMFLKAPGQWLSHDEIMNLGGAGSGSPRRRVSVLRAKLREVAKADLIKPSSEGAGHGYRLKID